MEEARKAWCGFFFADAVGRFDAVFDRARREFTHVFGNSGGVRPNTFGKFIFDVGNGVEVAMMQQMLFVAENDVEKLNGIKIISLYEYFALLNVSIREQEKQSKMNAGNKGKI